MFPLHALLFSLRVIVVYPGWPLSRQCEIPWRFAALLRGTQYFKCYSYHACTSFTVSGGGRNATVHDPKPYIYYLTQNKLLLNTCMDANMQLTINSFRQLFPDTSLTFSIIPDISMTAVKFPEWHFQFFQTSGHPMYLIGCYYAPHKQIPVQLHVLQICPWFFAPIILHFAGQAFFGDACTDFCH